MKIVKKVVSNGEIVGYVIDDEGLVLAQCNDALYTEIYMKPLLEAGYKYYGRDARNIKDANGVEISTYESVDLSEIDELEWAASLDHVASSLMTDVQASQYYTFDEESKVEFRRESSYEINTREELISYLKGVKHTFYSVPYVMDNRPLNYFVNPDALFTVEELSNDIMCKEMFEVIIKRHHFRNYDAYKKLVAWLMEQGVLNNSEPTEAEFLNAYYAWGPEGIKDTCIEMNTKLNADGYFMFNGDPLSNRSPLDNAMANRERRITAVDANYGMHFLKWHQSFENITDTVEFGRSRIAVESNETLFQIKRMQNEGYHYSIINEGLFSDVSDRLVMTLRSSNDYTYVYKVSYDKMKIGLAKTITNSAVYSSTENFTIATVVPSVNIPVTYINNPVDYYMWNCALVKTAQITSDRTFKPPYDSTSDFLLEDGVNPIAAVEYVAHAVNTNKNFLNNRKYTLVNPMSDMYNALELYLGDVPTNVLTAYRLTEEDINGSVETFLELADIDDLRDRREDMQADRLKAGEPGWDPTFTVGTSKKAKQDSVLSLARSLQNGSAVEEDALDYYTKVKFIHDCLRGKLSVNNFGEGTLNDLGASYLSAAQCILTTVYAAYGNNIDKDTAREAITNIDSSNLIDMDKVFRIRDRAAKGFKVDMAEYRSTRGSENTWLWAYCTKVFREISNAPINKQRPYLMELVVLENTKQDMVIREFMTELVKTAILESDIDETPYGKTVETLSDYNDKSTALKSAGYLAARLFFYVCAGGIKGDPVNGFYEVKLPIYRGSDLVIKLPEQVYKIIKNFDIASHKKYMTVYDYCKYEYNPVSRTGTFRICVVNADIDPWHVKPKKGYHIKSYSLLPNYYESDSLDKANGEGFYNLALQNKEITVTPFVNTYKTNFIPSESYSEVVMVEDEVRDITDIRDIYTYLDKDIHEYIFAYIKRWVMERKKARELGKKLLSIPLKQDVVYHKFAPLYCEEIPSLSAVYSDEVSDDRASQRVTTVSTISWRQFEGELLTTSKKKNVISRFSVRDVKPEHIVELEDVLSGKFNSTIPVVVTGNYINIKGDSPIRLLVTQLSQEQLDNFVAGGVMRKFGGNKYFIGAANGDFVLDMGN